jgi:hypothetical protein
MATTQNTYTGNGSTVLYSFTFPYLATTDIKVSVNGTNTTAYTLANATTIQFTAAPANGAAIRIYRATDDSQTKTTFFPGSSIRAQGLNDNFLQLLYVSQETQTFAASTDASAIQAQATAAVNTANAATITATTALTTANAASTTANGIAATANSALTTANAASTTANGIAATANTALTTANTSLSTANAATTTANTALTTANAVSSATAYTTTTTATSKTLANRERCTVTAATQTITLPASPAAGWEVAIIVAGTFTDTIVARNGVNIMSLAEDITLDRPDVTVTLYYVDATRGWRVI